MDVRLLTETASTVTFGWDPVPGARGFRYTRPDGVRSHTWDGGTVQAKFKKMQGVYLIEPLMVTETGQGIYPPVVVPPSPPVNTTLPAIIGTAQVGEALTASPGTWSGLTPISYAFAWSNGAIGVIYVPVAADIGDSLTVTVKATNADGSAQATSGNTEPVVAAPAPPVATGNPLMRLRYASARPWGANLGKYGTLIVGMAYGAEAAQLPGRSLVYVSGTNVAKATLGYDTGVGETEARANGWILKDAAGVDILNAGYPFYFLGDVGDSGYQQAWCRNVEAKVRGFGCDGFFNDDLLNWILGFTGGKVPAKYPTDSAWDQAMFSFAVAVGAYFKARGIYVSHNAGAFKAGDNNSNDGTRTLDWFQRLAPHADGLMCEGWMSKPNAPAPPSSLGFPVSANGRLDAPAWWNNWAGWRRLHPFCAGASVDFLPVHSVGGQEYLLATFLLDWDGVHGGIAHGNYVTGDPWTVVYDRALALGQPTGSAVKSGNVWTRQFAGGSVTVDPVNGTAAVA
jgi:hypothetical protein